jgi:recombining binding protein (suppressor of hairless)
MQLHHNHGPDVLRGVAPQSTHSFRPDVTGFDDMYPYIPNPTGDLSLRMPGVDDTLARMKLQGQSGMGSSNDLQTFIRFVFDLVILPICTHLFRFSPFLDQFVRANNRLAFGERTVIVMSSKVAQKSYGTEKRFLCPPPTAIMIGNSWWTDTVRRGEEPRLCPPRVDRVYLG